MPGTDEPGWDGPLPEPVRVRVAALAADTLGALQDDEVPASLRRYRSWAPAHRAKRAATPLAGALERDVAFRQRTYARALEAMPDLAEALSTGDAPPAADPVDVATVAYLGRTPGWAGLVAAAGAELDRAAAVAEAESVATEVARLREELAAAAGRGQAGAGRAAARGGRGPRRGGGRRQGAAGGEGCAAPGGARGRRGRGGRWRLPSPMRRTPSRSPRPR